MRKLSVAVCFSLLLCAWAQQQAPPKTHLKVGDMAPDFTLPSTAGKPVKLSDFRGQKTVILAFFPAAFTGGCTKEMLAYQAGLASRFGGAEVFGISTDNVPSLGAFAEKLKLHSPGARRAPTTAC